jgi:uncharacterized protein YjbI with pentapeptide repeats/DNA-binding Xre family transcriptional regulator
MTDSSLPKKKEKVTLTASEQGLITAKNALVRLGFESKSNFAASQLISRSTVTKFFQGAPIQLDTLKRICDALELTWQEIAGMSAAEHKCSSGIQSKISDEIEEVGKMPTILRQVKVVDPNSKKVKAVITLEGDVNSVDSWEIIQLLLRQNSGSSINIIDIESGSIRLTVEGSHADIQKLLDRIRSGELTKLNGLPVQSIEISTEILDAKKIDKWNLVKEIVDRRITGRNLRGANLIDTDLSGANLIDADLSGANLIDADLSGANLSGANLSGANLRGANLSGANLRGANLSGAYLSGVYRVGANLNGAYLSGVYLNGANLSGANLIDANLIDAYLCGVNLNGANLSGVNLNGANLSGVNLNGANLSGANLSGANLSGANLSGADVEKTRFGDNQGISESMKLDLKNRGAIFEDSPGDRSETYALR